MSEVLVAYFSVSGVTKKIAEELAKIKDADVFVIQPEIPYTAGDLDWRNEQSRSSLEMKDLNSRPKIAGTIENLEQYETIFLGFPCWWGREPSVIDTFIEAHNFDGKKIIPFCTSGGSGIGGAPKRIQELAGERAIVAAGSRLGGDISEEDLKIWTQGID